MSSATLTNTLNLSAGGSLPLLPLVLLMADVVLALYCYLSALVDTSGLYWLILLGAIQVFPMLLTVLKQRLDYLAVSSFATFATYTLGKYNNAFLVRGLAALTQDSIAEIREMVFCTLLLMATFYLVRILGRFDRKGTGDYRMIESSPVFLVALSALVLFQPIIERFIPWNLRNVYVTLHGFLFFLLFCLRSSKGKFVNFAAPAMVFLSGIIFFLNSGMMTFILVSIILTFVSLSLQGKFKRTFLLVFLLYPLTQVQMVKGQYRGIIWTPEGDSLSLFERLEVMAGLLAAGTPDDSAAAFRETDSGEEDDGKLASALDRASDESLERVLALTPSSVPFWNGETYESLLYAMVPRFVWPSKPSMANFNKFGKVYGYLGEDDNVSSVGATCFAEGYMNFGYVGLYGVAILMGFVLAMAQQLGPWMFGGTTVLGFVVFFMPLSSLSSLGVLLPPLLNLVAVVFPFRKLIRRAIA